MCEWTTVSAFHTHIDFVFFFWYGILGLDLVLRMERVHNFFPFLFSHFEGFRFENGI